MSHRGVAAKAMKLGHTANADWVNVDNVPFGGPSPELPKLPNRRKWNELVIDWWERVRVMPHCSLWEPTDWTFAIETALIKQAFWTDVSAGEMKTTAATEIRRREDMMGTTAEARRKLRIRYVKPDEDQDPANEQVHVVEQADTTTSGGVATVTPITDRRSRLTQPQQQRTA